MLKCPVVGLIWAQSSNDIIGRDNDIPSEFDNDLSYFKEVTMDSTIVMGRKTWESLPRKPLPGRVNVVLTSNKDYKVPEGVKVISRLEDLELTTSKLFFIGGKAVYELGLKYANQLFITVNHITVEGDVKAPDVFQQPRTSSSFTTPHGDKFNLSGVTHYQSVKGHEVKRYIFLKE